MTNDADDRTSEAGRGELADDCLVIQIQHTGECNQWFDSFKTFAGMEKAMQLKESDLLRFDVKKARIVRRTTYEQVIQD